jgi:hypothetical protein
MCFSDGILKRYVLEQTVWSKLDEELQMEIFINRHSKAFRETYSKIIENPHKLREIILGSISEDASVDDCECVVSFLHTFYEALAKDEIIVQLYNALKPLKNARKLLKSIEKNPEFCAILNIATVKPIEQNLVLSKNEQILLDVLKSENKTTDFVSDMVKEYYGLSYSGLPKVCFADGEQAPDFALAYLLTVHEESYVRSGEKERSIRPAYEKPGICENAQKVVTLLDSKSLQSAIMVLAERNLTVSRRSKRMYLAYPIGKQASTLSADEEYADRCTKVNLESEIVLLKQNNPADNMAAFKLLKADFDSRTGELENLAKNAGEQLSNAFIFCEEVFGEGQELLILVTELTISYYGVHFISRYGCKEYFAHNKELLFYERPKEIIAELENLEPDKIAPVCQEQEKNMTVLEIIVHVLENLGGSGSYSEIYQEYESFAKCRLTPGQKAGIRKCIETHSSDSENFSRKKDIFYSVEGMGYGVWGLRRK